LRSRVPSKELNEAMKSDEAMRAVVRKYDRVRTDAEVDKMVAALMGRAAGQTAAQE
jgi:hypothetical protein